MNYLKPQVPLRKDENYIYPLTSVDQIVTESGGRLNNEIITVDLDTEYNGETKKLNADLLGGRPESDFLSIDLTDAEKGEFYPIYAENGIYEYAHSAGSLTGQGVNGKFKATVNETVTNLNINGETFIVNCNGENSIELKNGCWYSFILDGEDKTVNFKSGGISKQAIEEAVKVNKNQIIAALQYSGLGLTENSTIEEICEVLLNKFPPFVTLIDYETNTYYGTWHGCASDGTNHEAITETVTNEGVKLYAYIAWGLWWRINESIDLTKYKTVEITLTENIQNLTNSVGFMPATANSGFEISKTINYGTFTYSLDVSNLTGHHRLAICTSHANGSYHHIVVKKVKLYP